LRQQHDHTAERDTGCIAVTYRRDLMEGFERTGELLARLCEVGRPRVSRLEDGEWTATVEFPSPQGVTAKVQSDFNHNTPDEALQTVIDRIGGLRDMLSVPAPTIRLVKTISE